MVMALVQPHAPIIVFDVSNEVLALPKSRPIIGECASRNMSSQRLPQCMPTFNFSTALTWCFRATCKISFQPDQLEMHLFRNAIFILLPSSVFVCRYPPLSPLRTFPSTSFTTSPPDFSILYLSGLNPKRPSLCSRLCLCFPSRQPLPFPPASSIMISFQRLFAHISPPCLFLSRRIEIQAAVPSSSRLAGSSRPRTVLIVQIFWSVLALTALLSIRSSRFFVFKKM